MKGSMFNLFEAFITENWGEDTYEDIYDEIHSQLETKEPFVGPGTYPDHDMMALVGKAVEKLGVPLPDALKAFGKFCFPRLAGHVKTTLILSITQNLSY